MKAIVYTQYGPPEVLQLKEVPKPTPKGNEVLIKIFAATVNRTDCGFRKPEYPLIIRPINGLFRPNRHWFLIAEYLPSAINSHHRWQTSDVSDPERQ